MEFRLPNLGEGIESATVTGVYVEPGAVVRSGQNVVAVETDKAAVEVPAESDGVVDEVRVKPGDKIPVGAVLYTFRAESVSDADATRTAVIGTTGPNGVTSSASAASTRAATARAATAPAATAAAAPTPAVGSDALSGSSSLGEASTSFAAVGTVPTETQEFALPNLGEGIDTATVTAVLVKPGDAVKVGQNVLAVETDKAAVEVPAEVEGVVERVLVEPGQKVAVGAVVLTLQKSAPAPSPDLTVRVPQPAPQPATPATPEASPAPITASPPSRPSHNPPQAQPSRPEPLPGPQPAVSGSGSSNGDRLSRASPAVIPAGPATRRLARELGVGLHEVKGTGRGGRITLDDVKAFVRTERAKAKSDAGVHSGLAGGIIVNAFTLPPLPDFSKYGPVEVRDVPTIRQTIAKNLTVGWRTMPMVTQHELADITELEAGRKRIVEGLPKGSPKITMTVLAVKACVAALKEFPHFNSSFDMNSGKLILKRYYGIGIAVDTDRGLVVPVIRDADKKSIRDLAAEVADLAERARANKLAIDEMRGGTFTITNLGGIGGVAFTPIVNYPEVAILGLSRSSWQPVVRDGAIVPRLMMPLSLTYDHRVIDGADGCRFTVRLAQLFSDPLRLLMET